MVSGVSPLHTSVPREPRLATDEGGERLVVCAAVDARVEQLLDALAGPVELLYPMRPQELEPLLRARLAHASVGLRLHAVGAEAFVRRVHALGEQAGLLADELDSEVWEEAAFRVACVHCRSTTEPVAETIVRCAGCGRTLTVYHHFSRRKGAYMGFQADAEAPGELPAAARGLPCP